MKILVLAGGISTERDVSLASGKNILKALKECGHNAKMLDLFLGYQGDPNTYFESGEDFSNVGEIGLSDPIIEEVKASRVGDRAGLFGENVMKICRKADIVFLALHGEDGENGKVQASLDTLGIKYTGSGCLASAIAMNKFVSKQLMFANNITNAEYIVLKDGKCSLPPFGVPCVIKPSSGGSSVGVTIVTDEKEYEKAVGLAFKYENEVIVEKYIKGREFSVGVLGDTVLPPIEIIPKEGFYDYANKYQPGATVEICPAQLSEDETAEIQKNAKAVFDVLGLEVYGRIDFILNEADGKFYALEANSLPGMTGMSLLPQEAKAIGIDYPALCDKIIQLSLEKYE